MPRSRAVSFPQLAHRASGALLVSLALGCAEPWPTAIDDPTYTPTPSAPPTATVTAQSSSDGYGGSGFVFTPALAPVAVGGTVIFRNESAVDHNVTIAAVSHPIAPGETFSYTFNSAGTFGYTCTIHPGMAGNVSVVAP